MNSCLLLLPALDGKALFTVEDVATHTDLHPVQRALIDLHASQCGFCTPGFVMSLWADYQERTQAPQQADILTTLSGNLCRCTGYRPIIDAARAAWDYPPQKMNRAPVTQALSEVSQAPALVYAHEGRTWYAPRTIADLVDLVADHPQARIVAGATDLGLWVTKGLRDLGDLITTTSVSELKQIRSAEVLEIGAAVSLTEALAALVARHPELAELADRFASTPVRNAGTLGGNVANGSPIGDSMPVLLALSASVVLQRREGSRTLPLDQFYLGYQKTAREPGEVLTSLRIPPLAPGTVVRAWKVSKRRDQDISAVCGAFALTLEGGTVTSARLAYGGMAAIPSRARRAEEALVGRRFDQGALRAAQQALDLDFSPLTDGRATAGYRRVVAANLLTRLYEQVGGEALP